MPLMPEIPEWEGEPAELFGLPASHEAGEEFQARTEYELARVLDEAGVYDPDFLDSLTL